MQLRFSALLHSCTVISYLFPPPPPEDLVELLPRVLESGVFELREVESSDTELLDVSSLWLTRDKILSSKRVCSLTAISGAEIPVSFLSRTQFLISCRIMLSACLVE